jgi:exopolysaccharide biosynthesis protein
MNMLKILFLLLLIPFIAPSQQPFKKIKTEKIKSGMFMEKWSGTHEKWGNQFIVLVKAKTSSYRLDLAFAKDSLIQTSVFGRRLNAFAAINGGFFDMKAGGSVSFLFADGKMINENKPNVLSPESEMGANAIVIYNNGSSDIIPTQGAQRMPNINGVEDALVTGPLLIQNHQISALQKRPFNDLKHPRSAVCITNKEIWLIAVDGRHKEAVGLSLNELSQFLLTCGCPDAINLDGGGSTTLFINTKKKYGIVNHPSDNKKFDADGERPVANILYLRKSNQ